MNVSYKWLKEYVDFSLTPHQVADALTSIGLEVEGVEEVQSIKGGLEGLVRGRRYRLAARRAGRPPVGGQPGERLLRRRPRHVHEVQPQRADLHP